MTDTETEVWQVAEVTGIGLGELWFDTVADELTKDQAETRAEHRERCIAIPMPYNPADVPIGHRVDNYARTVVEK